VIRRIVGHHGQVGWSVVRREWARMIERLMDMTVWVRPAQVFFEAAHWSPALGQILLLVEIWPYLLFAYWKDICRILCSVFVIKTSISNIFTSFKGLKHGVVCENMNTLLGFETKSAIRCAVNGLLRWVFKSGVCFGGRALLLLRLVSWTVEHLTCLNWWFSWASIISN
jgi:hypothetical protein